MALSVFRAWQTVDFNSGDGQVYNTNVQETMQWDLWQNGDETIFSIGGQGNPIEWVDLLRQGVYSFHCLLAFWDSFSAKCSVGYRLLGYGSWPASSRAAEYDGTSAHGGALLMHDEQCLLPPDLANLHAIVGGSDTPFEGANPTVGRCEFFGIQESGIDRNAIFGTEMHIRYVGPFTEDLVALDPGAQPGAPDTPAEGIAFAPDADTFATPVWSGRLDVV
jgi:hypothetical protein